MRLQEQVESTPYQRAILYALQGKPVYQGTVPPHVIRTRRAADKVAKASRRINRASA